VVIVKLKIILQNQSAKASFRLYKAAYFVLRQSTLVLKNSNITFFSKYLYVFILIY